MQFGGDLANETPLRCAQPESAHADMPLAYSGLRAGVESNLTWMDHMIQRTKGSLQREFIREYRKLRAAHEEADGKAFPGARRKAA